MKKLIALVAIATFSVSGLATAGIGGTPNVDIKTLEKQWNGQPGKQATQYAGVLLHWKADACGKLNGEQFDATKCENKVAKNK